MICTQCKKRNAIGDKFCRECGTTLPLPDSPLAIEESARAERERMNERVSGLLSAAYTLAEQKRYDQALPLGEEAVLLLPDSTAALSLLATLYEYSGQDEKAIRTMERVVALNPESPGDRQKLGELRRAFQQAHSDEPFPIRGAAAAGRAAATVGGSTARSGALTVGRQPYLPFVLGGAAAACVLGVGLSIANRNAAATRDRSLPPNGAVTARASLDGVATEAAAARALTGATNAAVGAPQVNSGNPAPLNLPTYAAGADPFVRQNGSAPVAATGANGGYRAAPAAANRYRPYGGGGTSLPSLNMAAGNNSGGSNGGGYANAPLPPIIAVAPGANNGGNSGAQSGSPYGATESGSGGVVRIAAGPPPTTGGGDTSGGGGAPSASSPNGPGYIRITVGAPTTGGGGNASAMGGRGAGASSNSGGSALSRARNLQATGRYADAVAAYRESLASDSGSAGVAQQGIAQSEQNLHDDGAARTAYREALHAYELQLSAGRNVGAARRGIDVCKAALEALGG